MKQVYFYFLLALCCISIKFKAQSCALDVVGTTTVSNNSALADIAIDASNKVYSLAFNAATKNIELKSGTIASSWTLVATVPTVTNTTVKPALAINKIGEIIAFIRDEPNGKVGKVYKSTGGAFTQIGGAISVGPVSDLSIAFSASNELYIAYSDVTPSNLATVKRWNGSAWLDVGTGGIASSGSAKFNSLIIDNTNTPILAYQDGAVGFATTVSKYNGTSWNPFFTSASGPTSSTTLRCATNGDYYLGYIEGSDASVVQKYDGSSWNQLGVNITGLSSGEGNYEMNIDPANSPYIIATTTSSMVTAYRFDGGTGWFQVPAGFINTNISMMVNIAFDKFGAPYFGYVDVSNNNALNVKTLTSLVSIITQPNSTTLCNGNSGVFSITTGGPGSPTYNWQSNNSSSGFLDVVAPYSQSSNILNVIANPTLNQDKIRCVVDIGCRNVISNTATLTVVTLSATSTSTNPTCFNSGDGAINAIIIGGISPYTYTWSPVGGNIPNPTGLYWNTYTLTSADLNGCAITKTVTLTSPPSLNTSFSGNMNICSGSNTTLTITASGGTPGYTYSWNPGGSLSTTTGSVVIANPGTTQTYNVSVTDALGCVTTDTVMVNVTASPTVTSVANSAICNGSSATLNAGGANTYTWNPGNLVGGTQIVNPTSTTIYTVIGTNTLSGCTNSAITTVTVNPLPTVNAGPTRTLTCANTSTTLAGSTTGGVSFSWTGPGIVSGATTLNPTINAAGNYDLTVTSAQGCSAGPSPVTVTQNTTAPTPSASNSTTLTCLTTTGTVIGTGGGTYNWSGPGITAGAATATPTINLPGTYNLTVTAANGCTATANTSVTQNTVIPSTTASNSSTLTCTTTTVSLIGGPAAGVSYQWSGAGFSGGTTSQNAVANAAGIYTLLATSLTNGCTKTATTSLTQNVTPPAPTASNSSTLTCSTTTAMLSGTGGGTYNWSGPGITAGAATATPTINLPGTYNLTVTAANGCTATANTSVTQNTVIPSTTASNSSTLTCTTTTVSLIGGPAAGVSYQWSGAGFSGGTTSQNAVANAAGIYTLLATSLTNGCTKTATTSLTQNVTPPAPTASNSSTLTCSTTTAMLSGTGGGTYNWSGPGIAAGGATANPIINAPGCYTLIVTSAVNGCTATASSCITQNTTSPSSNAGLDQSLTCASPTVTLNGTSVPSSCTPVWTGGVASGSNSFNATASSAGDYTLTVTNPANGCSATDVVQVTANASIPTITISVSNTLTCANTTATTSASSSAALPNYLWSGPSVVSGVTTANAIVDQPGNYTITVTDIPTGCSATSNINVTQDITLPSVTIISSPSVICSGNSSTLTANGALTYTWSTTQNTTSISVSPGTTSSYTVSGTGTNGCVNSAIETITVNATPTLAITGNTNICNGSTSTLTGSGATSYTWDSGANTTTISVTPTITTTYTLTGDNGNGCSNSLPVTVSIIPNKAITGIITSTAGATGGDIIIYKYTANLSQWDSLTITPIGGTYTFNNIDSGLYVLRAMPTATNIQVTYAPNSISWQGATVINHGCTNNTTQNIDLIGLAPIALGTGVITGTITEASGFGARMSNESKPMSPGTPIGGIIVKGGKNPGGQMFVQTITDGSGTYTLTGLPLTGTDDYFIFVDIPGLDTNLTYHYVLTASNNQINGLNFTVDSIYINPVVNYVTGISNDQSVLESKITLFPNPANQKFTLEYELIKSANVLIELFDVVGHKVKTISSNSFEEKDKHSHSVNIEDLSAGVYFVKLKINDSETTIKLIIN